MNHTKPVLHLNPGSKANTGLTPNPKNHRVLGFPATPHALPGPDASPGTNCSLILTLPLLLNITICRNFSQTLAGDPNPNPNTDPQPPPNRVGKPGPHLNANPLPGTTPATGASWKSRPLPDPGLTPCLTRPLASSLTRM